MDDEAIVRELIASVYVTDRQRGALRRVLARAMGQQTRPLIVKTVDDDVTKSSEVEEDERHALLGPCGAE